MVRKLIAYDVIITDTAEELNRMIDQKTDEGWERRDLPRTKMEPDAMTGKQKLVYWQAVAKYALIDA